MDKLNIIVFGASGDLAAKKNIPGTFFTLQPEAAAGTGQFLRFFPQCVYR